MKLILAAELMQKYSKCEKCGNEMVGNGEGTLEITGDMFKRTCKCGWKIEVREDESNRQAQTNVLQRTSMSSLLR